MKKNDARKIDRKRLEAIRIDAVQKVIEGASPEAVIRELGMHRSCIYDWLNQYRKGGIEALKSRKAPGQPPKLKDSQILELEALLQHPPTHYGMSFGLWTRDLVGALLQQSFQVSMSKVAIGGILKRMGYAPDFTAKSLSTTLCAREFEWRRDVYPALKEKARADNQIVYFANEAQSGVQDVGNETKGYAPYLAGVCTKGVFRFMPQSEQAESPDYLSFFQGLLLGSTRNVMFIANDAQSLNDAALQGFFQSRRNQLHIHVLPEPLRNLKP